MLTRVGVELGRRGIRAVRLEGFGRERPSGVEAPWDPENPEGALDVLREHCASAHRVAIAIDLPLLFLKRVKLPAVSAAERREILRLEPDRFFPVRSEELVPAVRADEDLVFAVREPQVTSWVAALEQLAPVELVEPGPSAWCRALARAGIDTGTLVLDGNGDGIGLVDFAGGRVAGVRRLFGGTEALRGILEARPERTGVFLTPWDEARAEALATEIPGSSFRPLPVGPVSSPFLGAYGAALGLASEPDLAETLVSPVLGRRIRARHRRERALAALACAAGFMLLLLSIDAWRTRATRELDRGLASLRTQAAPALALQSELQDLGQRADAIRAIEADRPDPLGVLLELSERLPPGAYLRGAHNAGREWQIDGYAASAARVIAALGAAPGVTDLHFLSATNRAQVGTEPLESFALAFRFVSAP
ncbi:MAG TPA: PilN domain-containing protein [Gemmatimonadales bacterium]|nr:PilN domain-containing protein [Gemmatimonadales bacterium]